MKLFNIRSAGAVFLVSLLTACGGADFEAAPSAQAAAPDAPLAAAPDAPLAAAPLPDAGAAASGGDLVADAPADLGEAGGQNPTPDCQPENCQGLRIIDGNAEAWRFEAQRRGAAG